MNPTQLDRIEQKLDLLLAARDIDPNPGTTTDEGDIFAPGSGPIAEYRPNLEIEIVPVNPAEHIAAAKAALAAHPTSRPTPGASA